MCFSRGTVNAFKRKARAKQVTGAELWFCFRLNVQQYGQFVVSKCIVDRRCFASRLQRNCTAPLMGRRVGIRDCEILFRDLRFD